MTLQEKISKAEINEKNSNWDDAILLYKEIVKESKTIQNLERLGWCLSRAEQYDNAIKCFMNIEKQEPKMAKWKYMIGYQYYCKKNWKDAVKYFEEALKIKPNYFIVKYRISYAYLQLAGEYKKLTKSEFWKALGHIKECHKLWENFNEDIKNREKHTYFDINFLHGKMLMDLPNHREEATLYFMKALKIKDDEICRYNLSKTYYLMEKYKEAKKYIPTINTYYVIELDAYIEAKLKNFDVAISKVNKLLEKRKKDYLYAFLAEIHLLIDENKKAFEFATKAIKMNYNNHKNHLVLAKIYYIYKLYNSALKELEEAINLKNNNYHLEYEEAIQLKKEILNIIDENYKEDIELLKSLENDKKKNTYIGKISEYNRDRGFGFILYDSKKVFFHISDCDFYNPKINSKVLFEIEKGVNGRDKAINIKWK